METLPWSSINCNRVCLWAADYHLYSCISCFISRLNYLSRSTQVPWLPLEHLHNFPPKPNKLAAQELQLQSVCVLVVQSCPTLCDPMDCSQPGSSVHGIFQARTLELVAIPFSRIFLTQGSNLGLLHCRQILYHLSHLGSMSKENFINKKSLTNISYPGGWHITVD